MQLKYIVFIAHMDDEYLFAHNLITQNQSVDWHIVCATNKKNSSRGKEFISSCKYLNAKPYFLEYKDDMYSHIEFTSSDFLKNYDRVYTHNPNGEYFHPHHIDCFNLVNSVLDEFWVFAYNYKIPEITYVDENKLKSPILKIYERESYIIYNFDLITEGFCQIRRG